MEKFAIPRQPLLATAAKGVIELHAPYNDPLAVEGLSAVSHLWVHFLFHYHLGKEASLRVRPPRFGGNKKLGVFSTRSSFRPNPMGLSVVKLDKIIAENGDVRLFVSGVDMVNGTPIIDIKPYVPYVDCILDAKNNIADSPPKMIPVCFEEEVELFLSLHSQGEYLKELLQQVLSQDPRPAYQSIDPEKNYHAKIWDIDVHWRYSTRLDSVNIQVFSLSDSRDEINPVTASLLGMSSDV